MSARGSKPIVLLPACHESGDGHPDLVVRERYVVAVTHFGCRALIVPAADPMELEELLELADGILLTGSPSNVHPSHFGEEIHDPALPLDRARDNWTLPLVPLAIDRGVPILGICRGFQEMNVALGGSLYQAVHELPGFLDHRGAEGGPEIRYAPAHEIEITPGGVLAGLLGRPRVQVNSIHGQGVHRLAARLRAEAVSEDGLVEAFTDPNGPGFNLGVQWHPEWKVSEHADYARVIGAFAAACARYRRDSRTDAEI